MSINTRKLKNLICKIHHKSNLKIDSQNYILFCEACQSTQSHNDNLIFEDEEASDNCEDLSSQCCSYHQTEKSEFFCEDCKVVLCNECFYDHKLHKCYTFDILSNEYNAILLEMKERLLSIKSISENNLTLLTPVQSFYNNLKQSIEGIVSKSITETEKILNDKETFFDLEVKKIFLGMDKEIEEAIIFLNQYKENLNKASNDLKLYSETIDRLESDVEVCLFKKQNNKELTDIDKLICLAEGFLNEKMKKLKLKIEKNFPFFEKESKELIFKINQYEKSLTSSLNSGISSICYRIRRYRQFFSYEIPKYFHQTTLCFIINKSISLCGVGLCGLFTRDFSKINEPIELEVKIYEDSSKDIIKSHVGDKVILEKIIKLPTIRNIIDPVFQIYFDKAVTIYKDRVYYLNILNKSKEDFIKIWSGSIYDDTREGGEEVKEDSVGNIQTIICNDTLIKFNFMNAVGYESDYSEFGMGIICDLIYSYAN